MSTAKFVLALRSFFYIIFLFHWNLLEQNGCCIARRGPGGGGDELKCISMTSCGLCFSFIVRVLVVYHSFYFKCKFVVRILFIFLLYYIVSWYNCKQRIRLGANNSTFLCLFNVQPFFVALSFLLPLCQAGHYYPLCC